MAWVAILMGSESDWPVMKGTTGVLNDLGIEFEVRVTSAHRTPEETKQYIQDSEARNCGVFICAAGMAAHLAAWRRGAIACSMRPKRMSCRGVYVQCNVRSSRNLVTPPPPLHLSSLRSSSELFIRGW